MFYRFWRSFFRFLFSHCCYWEIEGLENFPVTGPVLVISNHTSYWDPVVVGCVFPRQVYFMAKKELYSYPVLAQILRMLGAFPVDRGRVDKGTIRHALTLLKDGKVLGIFPEGTRSKSGQLLPPLPGAAFLAKHAGVPICPVAITGARQIFAGGRFRKFRVRIGQPLELQRKGVADLPATSALMMEKIQELLDFQGT
jgi:1-acyl-sn-glycerol-3-phosphate acyltransferase